jgi:hypothetical protein
MAVREPSVGTRLFWSGAGFCVAVALAAGTAHYYETPNFMGASRGSLWLERDVLCAVASSAIALGVGLSSSRAATGAGATAGGSLVARGVIWAGFTALFLAAWVQYVFLFTLLIAPTHAFACARLLGLWSKWRAEVAWRRLS